jgi:hypothetical protein
MSMGRAVKTLLGKALTLSKDGISGNLHKLDLRTISKTIRGQAGNNVVSEVAKL